MITPIGKMFTKRSMGRGIRTMKKKNQTKRSHGHTTSYSRVMEAAREIDGIPVKLALQERTSGTVDAPWWVLSWRTRYSPNGTNRRFYRTEKDIWTIPVEKALEMMEELISRGALGQEYLDRRVEEFVCNTSVSTRMDPEERKRELANFTFPDEDWGPAPFFVVNSDPNDNWKKVLIVNTDTGIATFRSITKDPDYSPRKQLRPGADWWLDNSMMDANVQQMKAFHLNLRGLCRQQRTSTLTQHETRINASDFKARCLAILDHVHETGERVVILKRGKPVAELSRVVSEGNRYPQTELEGTVVITGDVMEPVLPEEHWDSLKR